MGSTAYNWWSPPPVSRSQETKDEEECYWPMETTKEDSTRMLNILQWNAEGIYNKKVALTARLLEEKIDIACIQGGFLFCKLQVAS